MLNQSHYTLRCGGDSIANCDVSHYHNGVANARGGPPRAGLAVEAVCIVESEFAPEVRRIDLDQGWPDEVEYSRLGNRRSVEGPCG